MTAAERRNGSTGKNRKSGKKKEKEEKGKKGRKKKKKSRLSSLTVVSTTPRIYRIDRFASKKEVKHIVALADDAEFRERHGVETHRDAVTGFSFEMPIADDPILTAIRKRMENLVGFPNDVGDIVRFRRYAWGESAPLRHDADVAGESIIEATAILHLSTAEEGGQTGFPYAEPTSIAIAPKRGRLLLWFNQTSDGVADPRATYETFPLIDGAKTTITFSIHRASENAAGDGGKG